nr:MAG TPA: hypothetical protein [Caudoviricetes sp.]
MLLNGIYLPYKQQKSEVRSNVGESASNDFSYILYHLDCRVGNNLHWIKSNFVLHEGKKICSTQ